MTWKHNISALSDHFAVPASAAIVGWIAATAWLVPGLPPEYAELTALRLLVHVTTALMAYVVARRIL